MRWNKMIKMIAVSMGILILVGCGWFRDRSKDYVAAEAYPTIKISPDLQSEPFSHEYQIPDIECK